MKLDAAAAILGVSIDDPVDVLKEAYKKKVIAFDPEAVSLSDLCMHVYVYSK